ncbi:PqqD family protein [Actinophytocola oryzae]|uniref:Coenzyme PQQ synthesis protein D (PqqD) n=1 Tax=Actinophytocola oryzae TaxID=502181 RepID=A0A4R7VCQ5_9PSEU|nr:PqqD family protein [Actinophytocola oryzae]TDV46893.1 coenzyme PQQ synthesis protein D (PqqD) [Actinophytocola oryzae]
MRLRTADISARTIGGETIVLDLPSSQYFAITGVGSRVVQLLAEEHTLDDLVATIVDEYAVDAPTARADVEAFVERLRQAQLLA